GGAGRGGRGGGGGGAGGGGRTGRAGRAGQAGRAGRTCWTCPLCCATDGPSNGCEPLRGFARKAPRSTRTGRRTFAEITKRRPSWIADSEGRPRRTPNSRPALN